MTWQRCAFPTLLKKQQVLSLIEQHHQTDAVALTLNLGAMTHNSGCPDISHRSQIPLAERAGEIVARAVISLTSQSKINQMVEQSHLF